MRGRLGHTIESNTICFRTYKNFGIQVIKNPARIQPPAGKQQLIRHQLYYWSLHWNFLTPEEKAAYDKLGATVGIPGDAYYLKEKQDPHHLYIHPVGLNWTEKAYPNTIHVPGESVLISDDVTYEKHIYIKFPKVMLSKNLDILTATLNFYYYEEAGFDADDKMMDCYSITENWDWRTITWNNAPSVSPSKIASRLMPPIGNWLTFTVWGAINDAIADPSTWFGFMVRFRDLDPTTESMSGLRATRHHDNDFWPYIKLGL